MATRIKEKYLAEAVPALQQKFGYKNVMLIPKLDKIVINMGLGDCIREQLLFPEIEYDKVEHIRGMEMIFVTTAKTDEECKELLRLLGMPFAQA